jgi:hypothetical protein
MDTAMAISDTMVIIPAATARITAASTTVMAADTPTTTIIGAADSTIKIRANQKSPLKGDFFICQKYDRRILASAKNLNHFKNFPV